MSDIKYQYREETNKELAELYNSYRNNEIILNEFISVLYSLVMNERNCSYSESEDETRYLLLKYYEQHFYTGQSII